MATIIKKYQLYGPKHFILFSFIGIGRIFRQYFQGSYSQNNEDLLIEKLLNKKNISYLDIGSNHPIKFSNTYRYYLAGAHGYNLEPNLALIKKYQHLRPKDKNIQLGISKKEGHFMFYQIDPDVDSTFSLKQAKKDTQRGCTIIDKYLVKTMTLKSFFQKYIPNQKIDLLSIDTEGYDYQILQSNDWKKFRPKIICVEDNTLKTQHLLINQHYSPKFITLNNTIYIDESK